MNIRLELNAINENKQAAKNTNEHEELILKRLHSKLQLVKHFQGFFQIFIYSNPERVNCKNF